MGDRMDQECLASSINMEGEEIIDQDKKKIIAKNEICYMMYKCQQSHMIGSTRCHHFRSRFVEFFVLEVHPEL
jgi:hypothetical protein